MRPGFIHEVDESTPPLLIHQGHQVRRQRLPQGTRVVYPPAAIAGLAEPAQHLSSALAAPTGSEPLADRLRPGMKLTITFTVSGPPQHSDPRARVIEEVLRSAAAAGVDDVVLIAANGLGHKLSEASLHAIVGERVVRSFISDGRLVCHDAEDTDNLVEVARTDRDEPIVVNRRLAESDLIVQVAQVEAIGTGGWTVVSTGLASTATVDAQRGLAGVRDGQVGERMAAALAPVLPVFAIEMVPAGHPFGPQLDFLATREWEWTAKDKLAWQAYSRLNDLAPGQVRRLGYQATGQREIVAIHAGDPDAVSAATTEVLTRIQQVGAPQADVLLAGVAPHTPHNNASDVDPLVANWSVLADTFGAHTGTPVLRPGGVIIACHALTPTFHATKDAASADFFSTVLPVAGDDDELAAAHDRFAADEWYLHQYRHQRGNHGLHPFHLWYATLGAREQAAEVIWVGANRDSAAKLGARAATTIADALEISSATVGADPRVTYLHTPPRLVAEVRTA